MGDKIPTDAVAREAAIAKAIDGKDWYSAWRLAGGKTHGPHTETCYIEERELDEVMQKLIAGFLTTSLEGADGKIKDLGNSLDDMIGHIEAHECYTGSCNCDYLAAEARKVRATLLTLVTALSAKELEGKLYRADKDAHDYRQGYNAQTAKLTAQKAAHAKILRDEADKTEKFGNDYTAIELRQLADNIENSNG